MNYNLRTVDSWQLKSFNALTTPTGIGTVVEVSPTQATFGGFELNNNDAGIRFLQVFFKPASSVTLGVTVPDMTFVFAASVPMSRDFHHPIRNGTGLSMACTTTETGTTPATIGMSGCIRYKD